MIKEIIINSTINEDRVAIIEDGKLAEYFIEFPDKERYIGNIYLGKVSKIKQGLNAAFVDIDKKNDAFLHFSDIDESLENSVIIDEDDDVKVIEEPKTNKNKSKTKTSINNEPNKSSNSDTDIALRKIKSDSSERDYATFSTKKSGEIQITLEEKQDVIVQVTREAYSTKGVKVTSKIALPGRYLVLLPFETMIGVSKKIQSFQERRRLRTAIRKFKKQEYGCIIRTASIEKTEEELKSDWESLVKTWQKTEEKVKSSNSPTLIYKDMTLAKSIIRDSFTQNVERITLDSKQLYNEIIEYLKLNSPNLIEKINYFDDKTPIFDAFGIERDIQNIYRRSVRLNSGGSVVFDQTEAMMIVDVNSGRATESDQEKTAVVTNLDALKEISKQLRLRDIGGMIVIDFIDMMHETNRKKLLNEMRKELYKDRAKTVVYPLTQLGLLQITRQRINQNISEKITEICPSCFGLGRVISSGVVINNIERWLKNFRNQSREFRLLLKVHSSVAKELNEGTISKSSKLMIKFFVRLKVLQDDDLKPNHFAFYSVRQQKEITKLYLNEKF